MENFPNCRNTPNPIDNAMDNQLSYQLSQETFGSKNKPSMMATESNIPIKRNHTIRNPASIAKGNRVIRKDISNFQDDNKATSRNLDKSSSTHQHVRRSGEIQLFQEGRIRQNFSVLTKQGGFDGGDYSSL